MLKNNTIKAYVILCLYAILIFLAHLIFNNYLPYLSYASQIMSINLTIFSLYAIIYGVSKWLIIKNSDYKPLIILGSISFKMLAIIALILIIYLNTTVNKEPYIFSLFAIYILYIPIISYFYIKDI